VKIICISVVLSVISNNFMNKAISFVKESIEELKKVTWPKRDQVINYTMVVVGASIAVAIFLGVLDMIFSAMVEQFIF